MENSLMNIDNLKPHTIFFDKARFSHPEYNHVMKGVEELLKCGGFIPVTNCLLGPSRVGKSVVIEQIEKQYQIDALAVEQPIVTIELESKSTPKMILESLIESMGVKPYGNSRKLRRQLNDLAKRKGVRMFIIDETQHAMPQHQNSSASTQAIADVLKLITDGTQASVLLVGLEKSKNILLNKFVKHQSCESNEEKQMIGRSFPPMHIKRIKLNQKDRFKCITKGYQRLLNSLKKKFGINFPNVTEETMALRLWIACRGYFGRLRFLFDFSLEAVDVNGEVTLEILKITYDKVMSEQASTNPFSCKPNELLGIARTVEHLEALDEHIELPDEERK
jgi:hypothetical protein